jgi:hypothetical protein
MVMMTMAMTIMRVSMVSDGLSVGFVTMLMAFFFLFVAVSASTVFMVFSKMGMLVEESHSDYIDDKSDDSYDDHLAGMDDRRIVDSLKGFNEDIETDKNEEDSVYEAGKSLESIESIGEFTVGRESCLVRGIYTYCEGCGVEEHVG